MPKFDKMTIDKSLQVYKKQDLKVICKLKLNGDKTCADKRIKSKILKLDENSQYGYALTMPLPTGCLKNSIRFLHGENLMLFKRLSLEENIGCLFVVDRRYDREETTPK